MATARTSNIFPAIFLPIYSNEITRRDQERRPIRAKHTYRRRKRRSSSAKERPSGNKRPYNLWELRHQCRRPRRLQRLCTRFCSCSPTYKYKDWQSRDALPMPRTVLVNTTEKLKKKWEFQITCSELKSKE